MTFLISLETPTRGSYTLGFLEVSRGELKERELRAAAQRQAVDMLVSAGFDRSKIGIQVSDHSSLEIGVHRVSIIPIKGFDAAAASALAALLR